MRLAIALVAAACGTPGPSWVPDAGPCTAYVSTIDLQTPTVSLAHDVMPVFAASCASASCHGIADMPQGGVFLGAELAQGSDSSTVRAMLVGASASEMPTMSLVAAGDPTHSFLMHKLDGDQCQFDTACVGGSCMLTMPFGTAQLSADDRDTVRRWIAQGANDN